jgi:hypothetical protein
MNLNKPRSAARIGGLRGGVGNGGYERTDPDYVENHERKLVEDYLALEPQWRQTFLDGLTAHDKAVVRAGVRERQQNHVHVRPRNAKDVPHGRP